MPGDDDNNFEDIRLLYSVTVADLASFKQQQWSVTNYGLLLYAAIASVPPLIGGITELELVFLWLVSLAIMITGWVLQWMLRASLMARWERLTEIRKNHFSEEFRRAWRGGKSEDIAPDEPVNRISLIWFFQSVFLIGFVFDSWILYRIACAHT